MITTSTPSSMNIWLARYSIHCVVICFWAAGVATLREIASSWLQTISMLLFTLLRWAMVSSHSSSEVWSSEVSWQALSLIQFEGCMFVFWCPTGREAGRGWGVYTLFPHKYIKFTELVKCIKIKTSLWSTNCIFVVCLTGTYCQQREVEAITEGIEDNEGKSQISHA